MADNRIRILPPHVVNRIAAGEVVERPASVIKELVENALDAGATRIDVSASAGGRTLRVADNGCGMSPEDAKMAFYNHATSKITEESDLSRIDTLGFRGEALASIGAIAKVTCMTRPAEATTGVKVIVDALGEPQLSETGCAPGTIFEVSDLFYNTPARLKFLKRPQTELGHIEEVVQYLALSHPEIQFSLTLNDQQAFKTRGSGALKSAMEEVFRLSRKDVEALIAVTREEAPGELSLAGYISPPGTLKSSRRWIVTFVNGRSVRCSVLSKAIEAGYTSLIPQGKYPLAVLFLNLPHEEVDINVHPTKKEVRYTNANGVFGFIRQNIVAALEQHGHHAFQGAAEPMAAGLPTAPLPVQQSFSGGGGGPLFASRSFGAGGGGGMTRPASGYASAPSGMLSRPGNGPQSEAAMAFYGSGDEEESHASSSAVLESGPPQAGWKVVGQLFNTYILLETRQGLMVVDQHIASERMFFERLTQSTFQEAPSVQNLIAQAPLGLSPLQYDLLEQHREAFTRLGFTYELTAGSGTAEPTVVLSGMPLFYQDRQPRDLFQTVLQRLEETGEVAPDLDDMIATLACHSAVRAGDVLSLEQMQQVIGGWLSCKLPWTCPHGRPIAHTIATEDLNHFFHRPSLPVSAR
jgi:DNA mismatch repair protein MutL